jgi:hypothetical protein
MPEIRCVCPGESYRPGIDALYWKFGGPPIPVETIEPREEDVRYNRPSYLGQHLKPASARMKYAERNMERCEKERAEHVGYYTRLCEQGIDGLKWEHARQSDREMDARPGDWTKVPRNVDMHKATCVKQIGYFKARLASLRALIEELDRPANPLFYWRDDA